VAKRKAERCIRVNAWSFVEGKFKYAKRELDGVDRSALAILRAAYRCTCSNFLSIQEVPYFKV
jgi:hypothetical protein